MSDALWEILVPAFDRNGKEIPVTFHRQWDEEVRFVVGGLTIMKSAKGHWVDDNRDVFSEKMIPVRIMCTEDEINQIADMTAYYYNQIAVMFYKITDDVVIKRY